MPDSAWLEAFENGFVFCAMVFLTVEVFRFHRLVNEIRKKYLDSGYIPKELKELMEHR